MKRYDCLCVGILVADFICDPIAQFPPPGGLIMTDRISLAIGGCASNVAVDLAKLDRRVAVIGRVGNDMPGRFLREELSQSGVDTSHLLPTDKAPTSSTLIVNVRGEDRRFIHAGGANTIFDGSDVTPEQLAKTRLLYVGGFCLMPQLRSAGLRKLFAAAREAGVPTVLDVVVPDARGWWAELEQVLPLTDVFLPNEDEARALTGIDDPLAQVDRFINAGAKTAIVTCGSQGAVLGHGASRLRSKPFEVEFVDGTGSGDAFAAGFIEGLLEQAPPERCLELGAALGASAVRQPGATSSVFTRPELARFLAERKLAWEKLA